MSEQSESALDLSADYFSLFSIRSAFDVDQEQLKTTYLQLQQDNHPDRYANASETEQGEAVRRTAYLNQAYETLKSPLKRAIYMLEQECVSFDADSQTHTDVSFLMAQLELRERLEGADSTDDPFAELDKLMSQAEKDYAVYQKEFVARYAHKDWDSAIETVHKMMFASKLLEEIRRKEERLED